VAYVVDCGLVKEVQLASRGRGGGRSLVTTWCCRASAKQRMGRAGRVAPGVCFRLFSRYTHDKVMDDFAVPELQRTPLEELCLQVRANGLAPSCRAFLEQAPEPPEPAAVDAAIRVLQEVGALARADGAPREEEGEPTPLGVHLAKLPVDVRIGKVGGWMVAGTVVQCDAMQYVYVWVWMGLYWRLNRVLTQDPLPPARNRCWCSPRSSTAWTPC
jgi:ATP-dependent RNA helicase DHX29